MRRLVIVLAMLALVSVACGDDEGSVTETGTGSVSGTGTGSATGTHAGSEAPVELEGKVDNHGTKELTGSESVVDLEADDNYFAPTFLKARPSSRFTLRVENEGTAAHTFTVDALGIDVAIDPGAVRNVDVSLPNRGPVAFYCKFHRGTGMQGAFSLE